MDLQKLRQVGRELAQNAARWVSGVHAGAETGWCTNFQVGGDTNPGGQGLESNRAETTVRPPQREEDGHFLGVFHEIG